MASKSKWKRRAKRMERRLIELERRFAIESRGRIRLADELTEVRAELAMAEANVAELRESYDLVSASKQREAARWGEQRREGLAQNRQLIADRDAHRARARALDAVAAQRGYRDPLTDYDRSFIAGDISEGAWQRHMLADNAEQAMTPTELEDELRQMGQDMPAHIRARLLATSASPDELQRLIDVLERRDGPANSQCRDEIKRLADFIMAEVPGEPSQNSGAVDTAIRLLCQAAAMEREVSPIKVNGPHIVLSGIPDEHEQASMEAMRSSAQALHQLLGQAITVTYEGELGSVTDPSAGSGRLSDRHPSEQEHPDAPSAPTWTKELERMSVELDHRPCRGPKEPHAPHPWWDDHEIDPGRWFCDGITEADPEAVLDEAIDAAQHPDPDLLAEVDAELDAEGPQRMAEPAGMLHQDRQTGEVTGSAVGNEAHIAPHTSPLPADAPLSDTPAREGTVDATELSEALTYDQVAESLQVEQAADDFLGFVERGDSGNRPPRFGGIVQDPMAELLRKDSAETPAPYHLAEMAATVTRRAAQEWLSGHRDLLAQVLENAFDAEDPLDDADEIVRLLFSDEGAPTRDEQLQSWLAGDGSDEVILKDCLAHARGGIHSPDGWIARFCGYVAHLEGGNPSVPTPAQRDTAWKAATTYAHDYATAKAEEAQQSVDRADERIAELERQVTEARADRGQRATKRGTHQADAKMLAPSTEPPAEG